MNKFYYKLTDSQGQTREATQWGEGVTHRAKRGKMEFCTNTCIHCYSDPLMASFFNTIHGDFKEPQCWEGEVKGKTISDGCKIGCKEFTTIREVPLPEISTEQRIAIAIKCALRVYAEPEFVKWAGNWLNGTDRSYDAADAASRAAADAADTAYAASYAADAASRDAADTAYTAACAASYASYAAAYAADPAAYAAAHAASYASYAAYTADAAYAADPAAYTAAYAASYASYAAYTAYAADPAYTAAYAASYASYAADTAIDIILVIIKEVLS